MLLKVRNIFLDSWFAYWIVFSLCLFKTDDLHGVQDACLFYVEYVCFTISCAHKWYFMVIYYASRPLLRCRPRAPRAQHRGELVPTRNEIMGKIGASMLLSYSGLVVSYVTREGLGFVRVLHSRVVVSSCSYIREIAKQSTRSLLFYEKNTIVSCNRA